MPTTLQLFDGGTTINLVYNSVSNPGYSLAPGWEPKVAAIRDSELGGRGVYGDVVEEIPLRIFGTTAADAYAKLRNINRMLDQAERWWRKNATTPPVILKYSPTGATTSSSGAPLQALVLGRSGDATMQLAPTFNKNAGGFIIDDVRLLILRRGEWLRSDVANTSASAAAANGSTHTAFFTEIGQVSSPFTLKLKGFNATTTPTIPSSILLVGSGEALTASASRVGSVEAETMTATGYTSVADAANNARGGSVLRYTPTSTSFATSGNGLLLPVDLYRRFAIYAVVRNNSASATWRVRVVCFRNVISGVTITGPEVLIDASTTNPRVVFLGEILRPLDPDNTTLIYNKIVLQIAASTTSGPPTLDIDYLAYVAVDDEAGAAIELGTFDFQNEFGGGANAEIHIEHGRLRTQEPRVMAKTSSGSAKAAPMSYNGNVALYARATDIYALWMCPNGTSWRFLDGTPAVLNTSIGADVARAYLTPE